MSGKLTQGRRVHEQPGKGLKFDLPGDYGCIEVGEPERGERWWYGRLPSFTGGEDSLSSGVGIGGTRMGHTVVEHEDGTISVYPSILWSREHCILEKSWWHGYLEKGVWREC